MNKALDDFTSLAGHDNADSTVVFVSSHGIAGSMKKGTLILTKDNKYIGTEQIIAKLDSCPKLKNKPKIVIVEACR